MGPQMGLHSERTLETLSVDLMAGQMADRKDFAKAARLVHGLGSTKVPQRADLTAARLEKLRV